MYTYMPHHNALLYWYGISDGADLRQESQQRVRLHLDAAAGGDARRLRGKKFIIQRQLPKENSAARMTTAPASQGRGNLIEIAVLAWCVVEGTARSVEPLGRSGCQQQLQRGVGPHDRVLLHRGDCRVRCQCQL